MSYVLPDHITASNSQDLARVFLAGVYQQYAVEACISEGWIIRAKLNAAGAMYAIDGEFATERVTGVVTAEVI